MTLQEIVNNMTISQIKKDTERIERLLTCFKNTKKENEKTIEAADFCKKYPELIDMLKIFVKNQNEKIDEIIKKLEDLKNDTSRNC